VVDTAAVIYERDRRIVGNVLAGAVAFRLFIYLLPLVLGVVTLVGVLRGIDEASTRQLGDDLGMSAYDIDSVETAAEQSSRGLWVLVPLAVWAIYSGGVGAVKVLRAVHALAWGLPIERLRRGPAAAAATFAIAAGTFVLVGGLQALRERSIGLGLGVTLAGVVPFVALWLVVSRLLPSDPAATWTALLPGALLVGVTVWAAHLLSVYFLARRIHSASELYGSLGVAAAILAWLYLGGRLMVASAVLNAALWGRRRPAGRDLEPGPGPGR
jgi:uncharacterized BrkB/YihY/UPF0761 family membrane protein